jgi:hypothetical protein
MALLDLSSYLARLKGYFIFYLFSLSLPRFFINIAFTNINYYYQIKVIILQSKDFNHFSNNE